MAYTFKRHKHTDPRRDWIRANLPNGKEGFSFEDLDGIASTFPKNGFPRQRRHLLIEHKWNVTELDASQRITFSELHQAMKRGDPCYGGFYLVTWPGKWRSVDDDEFEIDFEQLPKINGHSVGWDELAQFYLGELAVKSLFDD